MKLRHLGIAAALVAITGWAVPAQAEKQYQQSGGNQQSSARQQQQRKQQKQQARQQKQKQQSQQKQQARQQQQGSNKFASVSGRLVGLRAVNLDNEPDKHVLAKLRTSSGKTVIVDLGTRKNLQSMRFRPNQPLTVMGSGGRINGKPILVADKVRDDSGSGGPTLTIVRIIPIDAARLAQMRQAQQRRQQQQGSQAQQGSQQGQQQQGSQARQQGSRQGQQQRQARGQQARLPDWHPSVNTSQARFVSGRVIDKREVKLQGQDQKHVLVKLRTSRGQTALIDLGAAGGEALKDLKPENGEFVTAIGRMGRVNGRPVLVADHVAEVLTIDRPRRDGSGSGTAAKSGAPAGSQEGQAQPASAQQPAESTEQQQPNPPDQQQQQQQQGDSAQSNPSQQQ